MQGNRRARTEVERRSVIQEVHNWSDDVHFRADTPLLAETGAVLWFEGDQLVVEHPDGHQTRHDGQWLEARVGDSRLAFTIGESAEAVDDSPGG